MKIGSLIPAVAVAAMLLIDGHAVAQAPQSRFFETGGIKIYVEAFTRADDVIWAMDVVDAQTLIFTQRSGRIGLLDTTFMQASEVRGGPAVLAVGSGGLHDVFVDPRFGDNQLVYFTYTKATPSGSATAAARARLVGRRLVDLEEIFVANNVSDEPAHWGSRLIMDADRHIYIALGDRHVPDSAQDLASHGGKLVRLHEDGRIPDDNPFVGRDDAAAAVWSYGHRNPQGLAIQPGSRLLFAQEHGPTGGDEINLIERGGNYGWPVVTHGANIWGGQMPEGTAKPGMLAPVQVWVPGVAPTGMTFYSSGRYPGWQGQVFSATLRGFALRLEFDGLGFTERERLLEGWAERIRDVVQGPDGLLYLATESGKIARLVPVR